MTPSEAKQWITSHFRPGVDPSQVTDAIAEGDFIQALDAVEHVIPFPVKRQNEALKRFLFAGCRKFDRWFVPTPFVVPPDQPERFLRFVRSFAKSENSPENVSVFEVHAIRDRLYQAFDHVCLPLATEVAATLEQISKNLTEIIQPKDSTKVEEFNKEKLNVAEIVNGLRDASLRSCCTFRLPYLLASRPLSFALTWQNLPVEGKIHSDFSGPTSTIVHGGSPMAPMTPTRWQPGETSVSLRFPALIDHSACVPPLQLPQETLPVSGWPKIFSVVFAITYEISWKLRNDADNLLVWIPSPSDLGNIEFWLETTSDKCINWIKKDNPSQLYKVFGPQTESRHIEFGTLESTGWHIKCRLLAAQYLGLGDTREALFWLNVGIEAFIADKIEEIATNNSDLVDLDKLRGAESYWDEAKALVASRFPKIIDEIDWPSANHTASIFRQLKRLSRMVTLHEPVDRIISHYRNIQRHRNELFHGENAAAIQAEEVGIAIESFDWLVERFGAN